MSTRDDEHAATRLAGALVNAYLVLRANGDAAAGSAALDALRSDPAWTAGPVVRAIVQQDVEGPLEPAELDLLRGLAGEGGEAAQLTVAALIDSLPDEQPIAEERVVQGLVALGSHSVPALLEALGNDRQRARAAVALGRCGDSRAVAPLIEVLAGEDSDLRRVAAETLGELGDPRSAQALFAAAQDADPEVRAAASSALDQLGSVALLAEIAETWRPRIEAVGGQIHLHGGEGAGERLLLTIDVPLKHERAGDSTGKIRSGLNPEPVDIALRRDLAAEDDHAPDPVAQRVPAQDAPELPGVEQRAPETEQRAPEVEQRAPDVEQRAPEAEQRAPDAEPERPVTSEEVSDQMTTTDHEPVTATLAAGHPVKAISPLEAASNPASAAQPHTGHRKQRRSLSRVVHDVLGGSRR